MRRRIDGACIMQTINLDDVGCDARTTGSDGKGQSEQRREASRSECCQPPVGYLHTSGSAQADPNLECLLIGCTRYQAIFVANTCGVSRHKHRSKSSYMGQLEPGQCRGLQT